MQRFLSSSTTARSMELFKKEGERREAQRDDVLRMGERETDNVRTEQRPAYRC